MYIWQFMKFCNYVLCLSLFFIFFKIINFNVEAKQTRNACSKLMWLSYRQKQMFHLHFTLEFFSSRFHFFVSAWVRAKKKKNVCLKDLGFEKRITFPTIKVCLAHVWIFLQKLHFSSKWFEVNFFHNMMQHLIAFKN